MKTSLEKFLDSEKQFARVPVRRAIHELRQDENALHAEWDLAFALWCEAIRQAKSIASISQTRRSYEIARDRYLAAHAETQDAIYQAELALKCDE